MPNWLRGIVDWAQANRMAALGIAGGVLVVLVFVVTPGNRPQQVQDGEEEDWFGGEALPGDVTTAKALSDMQVVQEVLEASVRALRAENDQLRSALQLQKERVDVQDRTLQKRLDDAIESGLAEAVERLAAAAAGRADRDRRGAAAAPAGAARRRQAASARRRQRPGHRSQRLKRRGRGCTCRRAAR